jgi:hypothetical protein
MASSNNFTAKISHKDDYGARIHIPPKVGLCGDVVDLGPHPTDSSKPSEKVFSVLIKKSEKPVREIRIPKKFSEATGVMEGDRIEFDLQEKLEGLPEDHFLLFCSDISKNENSWIQKKNIEKNTPDWIKDFKFS